jgi:hypothetical protein
MSPDRTKLPARCVVPIGEMEGDDPEDTALLRLMFREAESYLQSFDWCESIAASYYGAGVGKVVAVFLFQIIPRRPDIDEWLWVIVGRVAKPLKCL